MTNQCRDAENVQHPGILFEKTVVFSAQYKYNHG